MERKPRAGVYIFHFALSPWGHIKKSIFLEKKLPSSNNIPQFREKNTQRGDGEYSFLRKILIPGQNSTFRMKIKASEPDILIVYRCTSSKWISIPHLCYSQDQRRSIKRLIMPSKSILVHSKLRQKVKGMCQTDCRCQWPCWKIGMVWCRGFFFIDKIRVSDPDPYFFTLRIRIRIFMDRDPTFIKFFKKN